MDIAKAFQEGGPFMYAILVLGVFTFSIGIERFIALYLRLKSSPKGLRDQVLGFIQRGDYFGAESFARSAAGDSALGRVVAVGCHLKGAAGGDEEIQARMDELLTQEISKVDRRTGFLAMFGNVATLLGLLGTISGMIHSFAAVASASPADRATMLSKGISEAMNCTAFGLLVAIPALVAYAFFQNKTDRYVTELTENTTQVFNDLLFLSENQNYVAPPVRRSATPPPHPRAPQLNS